MSRTYEVYYPFARISSPADMLVVLLLFCFTYEEFTSTHSLLNLMNNISQFHMVSMFIIVFLEIVFHMYNVQVHL
jgi:hypothetical protein